MLGRAAQRRDAYRVAPALTVPELQADGCRLRGWRAADAAALKPACGDPEIARFTTVPRRFVLEDARAWVIRQRAHARNGTAIVLAIVPPPGDTPVGMVGLFGLRDGDGTARLGYWVVAARRQRGLATAAARRLADWGFTELQLAAIHIDREVGNRASARLAEKLGAVRRSSRWVQYEGATIELVRHTLPAPTARV
jgi:RimJ/RimL family protein N-acetyltransferase